LVALPSLPVFSSDSLPLCIHRAPLSISATPRREGLSVVMKEGTRFSRVGTTPGLASALAIIRLFASELYRVSPADPAAFIAPPPSCLSSRPWLAASPPDTPMRVEPMIALRHEWYRNGTTSSDDASQNSLQPLSR
jgi:hypothetical protein